MRCVKQETKVGIGNMSDSDEEVKGRGPPRADEREDGEVGRVAWLSPFSLSVDWAASARCLRL